ncbi:MAG: MOSC domain-containing protein [Nitrospiraceae bacterium]
MTQNRPQELGTVLSLWRYPVKSMMGEELSEAYVQEQGILGDRAYALLDSETGKAASAKNPGKWPTLFNFHATFLERLRGAKMPPVQITLPDGATVTSEQREIDEILSATLNRKVALAMTDSGKVAGVQSPIFAGWTGKAEEYWPDIDGRDHKDTVTDFTLPVGTFFDGATIHLVTTATLDRLKEFYPQGRFEVPRFRPNIVVATRAEQKGFVEQAWIDRTLSIGEQVRLRVTGPCARCVMTTLAQGDLPKDPGILRTAVQHSHGHVGVYAAVVQGGTINPGDHLTLDA